LKSPEVAASRLHEVALNVASLIDLRIRPKPIRFRIETLVAPERAVTILAWPHEEILQAAHIGNEASQRRLWSDSKPAAELDELARDRKFQSLDISRDNRAVFARDYA
jgi:hypothetical protein